MIIRELDRLRQLNADTDLFFQREDGRVILLPRDWAHEMLDPSGEDDVYAWVGLPTTNDWLSRSSREWLTTDSQLWFPWEYLMKLPRLSEAEARDKDPDLFRLLDAINSGTAV